MSLAVDDDLNFLDGDDDDGSGFDASALLAEPILDDDSGEFGLSSGVEPSGVVGGTPLSMPNNFNSNMVSQLKMQAMQQQQRPRQIYFQQQQPQQLQNSFNGFNHNSNMNNSMSNMNASMSNMNNSMSNMNNNMNNLSSSMGNMNHNIGSMNNNMSSMNNSMSNMNNNMQLPQNQLLRNQPHGGIDSYMSMNDSNGMQVQESQQVVNLKMQELQQQIQQVQSQIQQVQFQSSQLEMQDSQNSASQNGMGNMNLPQNLLNSMGNMNAMNNMNLSTMNISNISNLNQMQNQQSPFGIQGMMNHSSGMDRRAPDRSFSAPVVQRSAGFGGNFMDQEQQRRPQKQPQGGTSLAAMAASLQPGGQGTAGQGTGGGPPGNVNEAMEKLCESMRRSAMSRSMVRQLSGRSAPTSRDMSRSKSGGLPRGTLGRNPSGRSVQRANSGTDSLRGGPIRRPTQDTKHRIQRDALSSSGGPPGRGVFRHKSSPQGALGGTTRLQIDDNNVGMF